MTGAIRQRVLVLGGTGIFGGRIAAHLAGEPRLDVVVSGRNAKRGRSLAAELGARFERCDLGTPGSFETLLQSSLPALVIHAAGPFQGRRYDVAEACIEAGVHYLDLADAREFVCGIETLDAAAKSAGVVVGSGASSVPAVTSALVREVAPAFASFDSLQIALSPGNQNPRGSATIGAVLSYLGETQSVMVGGAWTERQGWGDKRKLTFPSPVGRRGVYACDVPDLELYPDIFGARTVRFHAGLELRVLNGTLTGLARLRRARLLPPLKKLAPLARRLSLMLFPLGSKNGALALWASGTGRESGDKIERRIAIVTEDDGPATPSSPGILLAKKLLLENRLVPGAYACANLLSLNELLDHLEPMGIWCAVGEGIGGKDWARRGHDR